MSKFINVVVRERMEGTPGFIEEQEFSIYINPSNITLFNEGEEDGVLFVRMVCGATLCVVMSYDEFVKHLAANGCDMVDLPEKPAKKRPSKKTPAKKRTAKK